MTLPRLSRLALLTTEAQVAALQRRACRDEYRDHADDCTRRHTLSFELRDEYPHRFADHCLDCGAFTPVESSRRG